MNVGEQTEHNADQIGIIGIHDAIASARGYYPSNCEQGVFCPPVPFLYWEAVA